LSPGSVRSLALQGGPFTAAEVVQFRSLSFAQEAIRVRRWDEEAKVPGVAVPRLESYRRILEAVLL
jgi:[1-hydroxy-2-(trimethylamino)ethyl]phosphonate dioxygenase